MSENSLLKFVVCGESWVIQEVANGQEFRWEVSDQQAKFSGQGGDIPEEEFLLNLKELFWQAGQGADR